jgi:isoleucyl-tRNA synthetase
MAALGREFKGRAGKIAALLVAMRPDNLRSDLSMGSVELQVDSEKVKIDNRHVSLREVADVTQPVADFQGGMVSIDTTLSEEVSADGLARDLVRRIQQMRKEMDLKVDEFIDVHLLTSSPESAATVDSRREYMRGEVRAKTLTIAQGDRARPRGTLVRDWPIGDDVFSIGLARRIRPHARKGLKSRSARKARRSR